MIPFEERKPVSSLNGKQLFEELLDDACAMRATPVDRFLPAFDRICQLWRKHPEVVFEELLAAKEERTGNRHMPGTLV